jgi:hypothetical protein
VFHTVQYKFSTGEAKMCEAFCLASEDDVSFSRVFDITCAGIMSA